MAVHFASFGAYFSFNGSFLPRFSRPAAANAGPDPASPAQAECHLIHDTPPARPAGASRWPPDGSNPPARDAARARRYATVFASLPRDRLLVETDAPAMPLPEAFRTHSLPDLADGTVVNHPANIVAVYRGLAGILELSVEALAAQVAANFARFFGPAP
jgi:hypothetical protein